MFFYTKFDQEWKTVGNCNRKKKYEPRVVNWGELSKVYSFRFLSVSLHHWRQKGSFSPGTGRGPLTWGSYDLLQGKVRVLLAPVISQIFSFKNIQYARDLAGGPVVRNLPSMAGDMALILGWLKNSDPTCLGATKPCTATRENPCAPQRRLSVAKTNKNSQYVEVLYFGVVCPNPVRTMPSLLHDQYS